MIGTPFIVPPAIGKVGAFMPNTSFGDLLLKLRNDRNLTQEELATMIGRTYVAVGDWERGKRNPRKKNAEALANALKLFGQDRADFLALALLPGNRADDDEDDESAFSVFLDRDETADTNVHRIAFAAAQQAAQDAASREYRTIIKAVKEVTAEYTPSGAKIIDADEATRAASENTKVGSTRPRSTKTNHAQS